MLADNSLAGKKDSFFTKTIVVWFRWHLSVWVYLSLIMKSKNHNHIVRIAQIMRASIVQLDID